MERLQPYTVYILLLFALILSAGFVYYKINSAADNASAPAATGSFKEAAALEEKVYQNQKDIPLKLSLVAVYFQIIRETGDVSYYEKIEALLIAATQIEAKNAFVLSKQAELANSKHNFAEGLRLIESAITVEPDVAAFYGLKSDSLLELGEYDASMAALQEMVDRKPNFSSFSRVAHLRELNDDREGALEALEAALSAGSTYPENTAWVYTEMAKLQIKTDPTKAEQNLDKALAVFKDFTPALEGKGRIEYAKGNLNKANEYFSKAFSRQPLAQYAISLGNIYFAEGDETKAKQYYALADVAYSTPSPVNVDLEYAQFLADHGDPKEALKRAERAYKDRPSIFGADVYAWVLFKNNQLAEAQKYIKEALRLGEIDSGILYHAGKIAEAQGQEADAQNYFKKALELDQYASLYYSELLKQEK